MGGNGKDKGKGKGKAANSKGANDNGKGAGNGGKKRYDWVCRECARGIQQRWADEGRGPLLSTAPGIYKQL